MTFDKIKNLTHITSCTKIEYTEDIRTQLQSMPKGDLRIEIGYENDKLIDVFKIQYKSNGRNVTGYIVQPKNISGIKPVVVLNRGGTKHISQWEDGHMFGNFVCNFVKQDYILMTTQYSGNDGSGGKDEFGGMDLDDVLNLKNIIDEYEYADENLIAMCGGSRGGLMTYLSLAHCDWIKTACIWAASSDINYSYEYRPQLKTWHSELYDVENQEETLKRSPLYWVDQMKKVPLLLMHGTADGVVVTDEVLKIASKMVQEKYPYKLVLFPGGNHYLAPYADEMWENISKWLNKYLVTNQPEINLDLQK